MGWGSWLRRATALAALAATLPAVSARAEEPPRTIRASFVVVLAALPRVEGFPELVDPAYAARLPDGPAAKAVLEEARWVFGAMTWGLDFSYTPSDKARGIAELFEVRQRWADGLPMDLRAVAARTEADTAIVDVEYHPDSVSASEMEAWKRASAVSQGRGTAAAFKADRAGASSPDPAARIDAAKDAARSALREYLREITHNKPREVKGAFALAGPPRLFLSGGRWVASVRVYARIDDIRAYGAY